MIYFICEKSWPVEKQFNLTSSLTEEQQSLIAVVKKCYRREISKWTNATDADSDYAPVKNFIYNKLPARFMRLKDIRTLEER